MNSNYIQDSFLHTSNYFSFLRKKNDILMAIMTNPENVFTSWGGGGGVTPLFGLYRYVPLDRVDRVWFFGLTVLSRVYSLTCLCPKQV